MKRDDVRQTVEDTIKNLELLERVYYRSVDESYFSIGLPSVKNGTYRLYYPEKRWFTLWAYFECRHEAGHIMFHEMAMNTPYELKGIINAYYKQRRIFAWLQRFWYWNKTVRWFKIKLGFATKLDYGPDDWYFNTILTNADAEFFADYVGLFM